MPMFYKSFSDCESESEIWELVYSLVPEELLEQHHGYSFGELAAMPEFSLWQEELLDAEERWFEVLEMP